MRNGKLALAFAILPLAAAPSAGLAQTANASAPSVSSSGGNAGTTAPSGGTVSPQRARIAGKPAIGGTTAEDIRLQRKLDHDLKICKGC